MTDTQTEARALWAAVTEEVICNDGDAIEMIATFLAAKDAELAKVKAERDEHQKKREEFARRALKEYDRAERALEAQGGE